MGWKGHHGFGGSRGSRGLGIGRCLLRPIDEESLRHLPGGPVGNRRKQTGRATGVGIEPGPPDYESRVLPLDTCGVLLNGPSFTTSYIRHFLFLLYKQRSQLDSQFFMTYGVFPRNASIAIIPHELKAFY